MNIKKLLSMFAILVFCTCFAQEDDVEDQELDALEKVVTHDHFCVKHYGKKKIYLREDKIYPTEQGMFIVLNEDGDLTPLPRLLSNEKGCYIELVKIPDHSIPSHSIPSHSDRFNYARQPDVSYEVLNICPGCGGKYWHTCKTPKCVAARKERVAERKRIEKQRDAEIKAAKEAKKKGK